MVELEILGAVTLQPTGNGGFSVTMWTSFKSVLMAVSKGEEEEFFVYNYRLKYRRTKKNQLVPLPGICHSIRRLNRQRGKNKKPPSIWSSFT